LLILHNADFSGIYSVTVIVNFCIAWTVICYYWSA